MSLKEILKKQGLTDEQITAILTDMASNKVYETTVENAETRIKELEGEKSTLSTSLQTANTKITELETKQTLSETEKDTRIASLEADIKQRDLFDELKSLGCKNAKAVAALLDNSKLEYKDSKHKGLEDQVKALKESDSYLFNVEDKPAPGAPGGTGGAGNFAGKGNRGNGETESIGTRLGKQAFKDSTVENNPYF